jgi:PD-(D/E)XK nuclease superfamily
MQLTHSYSAVKLYENCPLRYYRQRVVKDVVDEGGEASKYGERIHAHLEARMRDKAALPVEAIMYEPLCRSLERSAVGGELMVEKELTLNESLSPTGWWDPDAWLRSKLDVLVIRDDRAIVLDWKTGKRNPDFFQMGIFAVMVFKHYPQVEQVDTSLVWLRLMEMDTETYHRESSSNELWADILGRIRRIYQSAETGNWPAKPSGLCKFCPARHDCAYART